jgi:uncharacterized membrane protein YadS
MPDLKQSRWTELWRKEDYWAIWLGFILIAVALYLFLPKTSDEMMEKITHSNEILKVESEKAPFKTIAYRKAVAAKEKFKASDSEIGKKIASFTKKPGSWTTNPLESFVLSKEAADARSEAAKPKYEAAKAAEEEALAKALAAEEAAAAAGFKDTALNETARETGRTWAKLHKDTSAAKKKTELKPYNLLPNLLGLMVFMGLFFGIGIPFMKETKWSTFVVGFIPVFIISVLSFMIANQATMKHYGIDYAAWAIIIGMLISNTVGTPKFILAAAKTEYFIKTGLVLLGTAILFGKILAIGTAGIFVAWVVTPIVLVTTYWFGQNVIKMPSKTLNITISSDMSVCGVSAAIATAAACKAKKEELTLAVGLSLVFTAIMMVAMPIFIKAVGMPEVLGGAWMGGTIDSTGAVAAAGAFLGEKALYVAATVKMIQNVLIGVIAFFVAVYWTTKVEAREGEKVSPMEIWYRFPKFVLGFIGASILFSTLIAYLGKDLGYTLIENGAMKGFTSHFQGWFFCLAFTSIGLSTNFRELKEYFKGGKPLILYVCGQSFNLCLTLLMAWIMFYKVFPEITASI